MTDGSTNEPKGHPNVENWLALDQDLTDAEVEAELKRLGFDADRLAKRFAADAASGLGEERRFRSRQSLDRILGVLNSFRSGLRGPDLAAALASLRTSLEPEAQVWQLAAFRSLKGDSEADEQSILEDLLALAELARREEDGALGE